MAPEATLVSSDVAQYPEAPEADAKLGFYGVAPISQPTNANEAAVTTTASTTTTPWGFSTSTQADGIVKLVNQLRADLVALGLIKGS